jgi:hypothetical protein
MMSESDFPEVPQTADELLARWASRDAEYAKSRKPLDPEFAEAVRQGRIREAAHLPNPAERARMYGKAVTWAPPTNAEFGSMKDFLE